MKFKPLKGDLPRDELIKAAEKVLGPGGIYQGATLYFKFTCEHCGERCILDTPGLLYEYGECCTCGKKTKIKYGGFMVQWVMGGEQHES